ncbi:MAG: hypothetical protein HC782_02255 [Gammaproteobacteria bacterium]|nr:hypothetical protein [Gammaproteobacteria bacterium]
MVASALLRMLRASARASSRHRIPLERIFTHRWKLDQADEAYRLFDKQASGKGVIEF